MFYTELKLKQVAIGFQQAFCRFLIGIMQSMFKMYLECFTQN